MNNLNQLFNHPYDEMYLDEVVDNLSSLFDIAINIHNNDEDEFAKLFVESSIAIGIEKANPRYLAGTSPDEMYALIINENDTASSIIPIDKSPQFWAGQILAKAQYECNKSFKHILEAISFKCIVSLYNPFHEADDYKAVNYIIACLPETSKFEIRRKEAGLTQNELSIKSNVDILKIEEIENEKNQIFSISQDNLNKLAATLNCTSDYLLK